MPLRMSLRTHPRGGRARVAAPAAAAAASLCAALAACGAPSGLGRSEPAPAASAQPVPEKLWSGWSPESPSPSDAVTDPELRPAPEPLPDAPAVPAGGFAALDQVTVLRADPRMKALTQGGVRRAPGTPGVRPAELRDLTGDGRDELISAVDLESGRVVVAVYTVRGSQIVPILHTSGVRPVIEAVGVDLVVRGSAADGGEQTVRYRWDGNRMITVSEVRSFSTDSGATDPDGDPQPGTPVPAPGTKPGAPPTSVPTPAPPRQDPGRDDEPVPAAPGRTPAAPGSAR